MFIDSKKEHIFVCVDCGGEARYVSNYKNPPKSPRCEACKRVRHANKQRVSRRAVTLAKNETEALRSPFIKKAHRPVDIPDRLPVVWFDSKTGKKQLIRATPTALLAWLLFHQCKTVDGLTLAVCRELRKRDDTNGRTRIRINQIDPPPCACGKPGLFIVNTDTYCKACKPKAVTRRMRSVQKYEHEASLAEKYFNEVDQHKRRAERHHEMTKKPKPR